MPRRSESFDKYVAEQMQDLDYARETLVTSIEHFGESVEDALRYTIEKMGIKELLMQLLKIGYIIKITN